MRAAEIAAALSGAHRSGAWWRCRCPVHCSRGPTLALQDGDRALMVKCFAGCDPHDILAELRSRGLIAGRADEARPAPLIIRHDNHADVAGRIAMARRLWVAAQEARRSPVATYLAGRSITVDPPPSLRWAPALRRSDGTYGPAMIARIDSIDGELIGIARTWLVRDAAGNWCRRDRAMLGRATGGAVRFASAAETLLIGEGIETCLAAMQATGRPAWAALSTSGMVALRLPPIVRTVVILADNDAKGAGQRAAHVAAQGWLAEGRRVRIAMPSESGTDLNNVLVGGAGYPETRNVAA